MKAAAAGTLIESPLFDARARARTARARAHARTGAGSASGGPRSCSPTSVFETVDAVVRDGQVRNVDLSDPDAATTVQMVLEDVIWRGPDVIR